MPWTKEQKRVWRSLNMTSDDYHAQNIKHNHGITKEQYNKMFEDQRGCCAICETHQKYFKRRLAIDHCHHTGKIRGLLCSACNAGIGKLRDDIDLLESAILYLAK